MVRGSLAANPLPGASDAAEGPQALAPTTGLSVSLRVPRVLDVNFTEALIASYVSAMALLQEDPDARSTFPARLPVAASQGRFRMVGEAGDSLTRVHEARQDAFSLYRLRNESGLPLHFALQSDDSATSLLPYQDLPLPMRESEAISSLTSLNRAQPSPATWASTSYDDLQCAAQSHFKGAQSSALPKAAVEAASFVCQPLEKQSPDFTWEWTECKGVNRLGLRVLPLRLRSHGEMSTLPHVRSLHSLLKSHPDASVLLADVVALEGFKLITLRSTVSFVNRLSRPLSIQLIYWPRAYYERPSQRPDAGELIWEDIIPPRSLHYVPPHFAALACLQSLAKLGIRETFQTVTSWTYRISVVENDGGAGADIDSSAAAGSEERGSSGDAEEEEKKAESSRDMPRPVFFDAVTLLPLQAPLRSRLQAISSSVRSGTVAFHHSNSPLPRQFLYCLREGSSAADTCRKETLRRRYMHLAGLQFPRDSDGGRGDPTSKPFSKSLSKRKPSGCRSATRHSSDQTNTNRSSKAKEGSAGDDGFDSDGGSDSEGESPDVLPASQGDKPRHYVDAIMRCVSFHDPLIITNRLPHALDIDMECREHGHIPEVPGSPSIGPSVWSAQWYRSRQSIGPGQRLRLPPDIQHSAVRLRFRLGPEWGWSAPFVLCRSFVEFERVQEAFVSKDKRRFAGNLGSSMALSAEVTDVIRDGGETTAWLPCRDENSHLLHLGAHFRRATTGGFRLSMFVPVWLSNRTGLPLQVRHRRQWHLLQSFPNRVVAGQDDQDMASIEDREAPKRGAAAVVTKSSTGLEALIPPVIRSLALSKPLLIDRSSPFVEGSILQIRVPNSKWSRSFTDRVPNTSAVLEVQQKPIGVFRDAGGAASHDEATEGPGGPEDDRIMPQQWGKERLLSFCAHVGGDGEDLLPDYRFHTLQNAAHSGSTWESLRQKVFRHRMRRTRLIVLSPRIFLVNLCDRIVLVRGQRPGCWLLHFDFIYLFVVFPCFCFMRLLAMVLAQHVCMCLLHFPPTTDEAGRYTRCHGFLPPSRQKSTFVLGGCRSKEANYTPP